MQEVHPQPENHLHARYPTDAPEPASVPGAAPAEIWARLAPGAYTRRWVFFRQALRSALLGICALPGRRAARRLLWVAGFALLLGGLAGAMGMILTGTDAALLPACLGSFVGYLLVLAGLTGTRSAWRVRRQLRRFGGAVLTPTHLHWKDSYGVRDLPLADLALVQRFPGWTVLVWKKDKLQALPLPDTACPMGGEALFYRLRQAAPRAVCRLSHRRLRPRWGFVFCLLAAAGLLFLNSQFLGMVGQGFQLIQIPDSASGAHIALAYNRHTGQFSLPGQAPFPYSAVGHLKLQWQSDACCAVTYQTTDGSIRVELLDGTDGQAPRLDPDPPTGRWQQYLELSDAGITLRWDEEGQCYHLFTQDGESVYHQWQQFDGLGLALCDDRGLPRWTLTPDTRPLPNPDSDGPVLLLCPVTLDKNGLCIPPVCLHRPRRLEDRHRPARLHRYHRRLRKRERRLFHMGRRHQRPAGADRHPVPVLRHRERSGLGTAGAALGCSGLPDPGGWAGMGLHHHRPRPDLAGRLADRGRQPNRSDRPLPELYRPGAGLCRGEHAGPGERRNSGRHLHLGGWGRQLVRREHPRAPERQPAPPERPDFLRRRRRPCLDGKRQRQPLAPRLCHRGLRPDLGGGGNALCGQRPDVGHPLGGIFL